MFHVNDPYNTHTMTPYYARTLGRKPCGAAPFLVADNYDMHQLYGSVRRLPSACIQLDISWQWSRSV